MELIKDKQTHTDALSYFNLYRIKIRVSISLLLVTLILVSIAALTIGPMNIPISSFFNSITNSGLNHYIIYDVRLPRIIATIFVGAAMASSGAIIQGLFQNPLAAPDILGISAGSQLLATLTILFLSSSSSQWVQLWALPISSILGSLAVVLFLNYVVHKTSNTNMSFLIVLGVILNLVLMAPIQLAPFIANDNTLRSLMVWGMASFSNIEWLHLIISLPLFILGFICLKNSALYLNALKLGSFEATNLGINSKQKQKILFIGISLLVGTSTALCGPVSMIGFLVPHVIRMIYSNCYRFLLPLSALLGACLMTIVDTFCRAALQPIELPVNIVLTLISTPILIYAIIKIYKKDYLL
ncbi:hypothetical protein CF386_11400 [Paraphotobacterium marinum]|uniref:Iron ABC transporter n=1 Tax=Paraphotobacterium marinum TaxID=1755811 RepID=A0A220VHJ2_9GAMM|nr:iron ABC transporter permease [Paraphotobacterium marinum]ASK79652.1 hypothetical protein CF386_11400 [Paraphotobacterium marinum]